MCCFGVGPVCGTSRTRHCQALDTIPARRNAEGPSSFGITVDKGRLRKQSLQLMQGLGTRLLI